MNSPDPVTAPHILVVDPKLAYIVSQVETAGFSGALRFEPKVYATAMDFVAGPEADVVIKIAEINHCTHDTARVLYSTSFGLYQIMGHNLYRMGFHRPVSEFLNGPAARIFQDTYFAKYLAGHGILITWNELASDPDKLDLFARHYNGSVEYAERMKKIAREHYGEATL